MTGRSPRSEEMVKAGGESGELQRAVVRGEVVLWILPWTWLSIRVRTILPAQKDTRRKAVPRPACKPHFVQRGDQVYAIASFVPEGPARGRSSIWADDLSAARAANPGLECNEQLLVPAWPCSWRGLPGCGHCCPHRWSLTPPFQPYYLRSGMFLWPDPAGCPAPGVSPAPCSVECGLSSTYVAIARLTWATMIQWGWSNVKWSIRPGE